MKSNNFQLFFFLLTGIFITLSSYSKDNEEVFSQKNTKYETPQNNQDFTSEKIPFPNNLEYFSLQELLSDSNTEVWNYQDSLFEDDKSEVKWGDDSSDCCQVFNVDYSSPFVNWSPLLTWSMKGYTDDSAISYFMRIQILKKEGSKWVLKLNSFLTDYEQECDDQTIDAGLFVDLGLGDCPAEYRITLRKGHRDVNMQRHFCFGGGMVTFDHLGNPELCDEI